MANDIITNLHPDNDPNTNLYPNIKKENIPSKSISTDKLDDNVLSLIGSLKPSGVDTSTNILAYTSNKGIYVATDNGHWYYWNGSAYADGGVYQATEIADGSITRAKLDDDLKEKIENSVKKIYGANLFNKNMNITPMSYINNNGGVSSNTSGDYSVSDYIAVKPNTTYSTNVANGAGKIAVFNNNKELLSSKVISENSVGGVLQFTTPNDCYYIRMTILKASYSATPDKAIIKKGSTVGDYVPFNDLEPLYNLIRVPLGKTTFNSSINPNASVGINVPNTKSGNLITFDATIENEITQLDIRHGYNDAYASSYIRITSESVTVYDTVNGSIAIRETYQHNLTLTEHISVIIYVYRVDMAKLTITTPTGQFTHSIYWEGCKGEVGFYNGATSSKLTNVSMNYHVKDYEKNIWAYGDSYFDYWTPVAQKMGATNCMFDGYGGRTSVGGLESLKLNLNQKTPKVILWCLGMNDADSESEVNSNWLSVYNELVEICENNNIELILSTIPNTPTHNHIFKNNIIRNSGYKYVDIAEAVGASEANSTWYDGLLAGDNIHPTHNYGKQVIASKMIASVPELVNSDYYPVTNGKLTVINDYVNEIINEVTYKDGVVFVRFQGTAKTNINAYANFLKIGPELYPNHFAGNRQVFFGENKGQPQMYILGNNQGPINSANNIESGSLINFMFSYYLGQWNYEIKE